MTNSFHLLRALCVGGLIAVSHGCSSETPAKTNGSGPSAGVPVILGEVVQREFSQAIEGIGTARAQESVLLTSRVNGRIEEIYFTEGARVTKGEPLVRLEDDEEQAELASAKATASQAQSRYQRMQALTGKGLIPKDQTEEQAQIKSSANARLELARVKLGHRTIRAPFTGQLGFKQVSPGTLVQPGTPIISLDAVETLRVEFSVPETRIAGLAVDAPVEVRAAAYPNRLFPAKVSTIGSRVDEVTRAVQVQALIDNSEGALKPGMLLTVIAQAESREARFVPEASVAPENSEQFVWRVRSDNTVEKVKVTLGARIPDWVEIVEGVETGDRVVVEGHANLRLGASVHPVQSTQASRRSRDGA